VGATVVTGVDSPPVFKAPEHVFDSVALSVEDSVMRDRDFAVGAGGDFAFRQGVAEPVGVLAPVGRS
jgi:hypothetical protein